MICYDARFGKHFVSGETTVAELRLRYHEAHDLVEVGLATPHPVVRAPDAQSLQFIIDTVDSAASLVTVGFSAVQGAKVAARIIGRLRTPHPEVIKIIAKYRGRTVGEIEIDPTDASASTNLATFFERAVDETDQGSE